jgi:hypothetical protein
LKRDSVGTKSQGDLAPKDLEANKQAGADLARLYSTIVERYAMCFDRPEDRLRFLNNTIIRQKKRQEQIRESLRPLRFLEKTRFYRWILEGRLYCTILEELTALARQLPANQRSPMMQVEVPLSARLFFFFREARHAIYAASVILVGGLLIGLYSMVNWSARNFNQFLTKKYDRGTIKVITQTGPTVAAKDAGFVTAMAPPPGYKLGDIWMAEENKAEGYELYSNGCRIQTRYETNNIPRAYYSIPRGSDSAGDLVRRDIAGVVYHTSESDIVPFLSTNNNVIQKRTQGLLEYIRREKSYNYLIDRYGGIYRVVRDNQIAYHSGDSIWADEKYTYVVLNDSFLGVCFESTVAAKTLEETLTEAQITAGRQLTDLLRHKYNIKDANCTTHGLVSVKPEKMLIAFHHDWVRNFPFELMRLEDKYKVKPPNMIDYGFNYDDETLAKLGNELWEGAIKAEEEFKTRAEKANVSPDELRRRMRDQYLAQREKARRLRQQQTGAGNPTLAAKTPDGSSSAESGTN